MLVYIDDREDEELESDYGYDYGSDDEYEYDSEKQSSDYVENEDSYFS